MNYEELKSILKGSFVKISIIGVVLAALGAVFFAGNGIALWIIGGLVLLLGLGVLIMGIRKIGQINSDQLPLLKAIKEKQTDYLVWVYRKQIDSQLGGSTVGTANNIIVVDKHNKSLEITLSKKTNPEVLIQYLAEIFPDAYVGYTDDNKEAVDKLLKA